MVLPWCRILSEEGGRIQLNVRLRAHIYLKSYIYFNYIVYKVKVFAVRQ